MQITLLGTAAGGGFPQWNCNCRLCDGARRDTLAARPRTQSSIFVQPEGRADGILFNASPDILAQIRAHPVLRPARTVRDTAIAAVVLTDGQIDHTTGLLMLRERTTPLPLWCTDPVHEDLTSGFPVIRVLEHYCGVARQPIPLDGTGFRVTGVAGLELRAFPLPGQAAPYSPHRGAQVPGDNIGVLVSEPATGRRLFYAPGLGAFDPVVHDAMAGADAVLVDGTCWTDDEMITLGLSRKRAREIGHLPQSGPGGMVDWMARLPLTTRRILVHINNTNPILDEDSAERAALARAGIEVGEDGMRIAL